MNKIKVLKMQDIDGCNGHIDIDEGYCGSECWNCDYNILCQKNGTSTICQSTFVKRWGRQPLKEVYDYDALGLCAGRHEIPNVSGYVFDRDSIEDVTDVDGLQLQSIKKLESLDLQDGLLDLYVTGLTPALIATLNAARRLNIIVTLYHYNNETEKYFRQFVK